MREMAAVPATKTIMNRPRKLKTERIVCCETGRPGEMGRGDGAGVQCVQPAVQRVLEEELHTHDLHAAGGGSGAAAHEHEEQQDELAAGTQRS